MINAEVNHEHDEIICVTRLRYKHVKLYIYYLYINLKKCALRLSTRCKRRDPCATYYLLCQY